MQITKNQHYVSKGILKHFSDNHRKIYELYIEKKVISKKGIDKTMAQNFVYEHPDLETNSIENAFANIESAVLPLLDKTIAEIEMKYHNIADCGSCLDEIKRLILVFVMFYYRSGALLYEFSFTSDRPKLDKVERLIANLTDSEYLCGLCRTISKCYKMALLVDEQERFLISDQYLSTVALKFKNKFSNASNRQIGMKETMILLPLSSKFYVTFYNGKVPIWINPEGISILDEKAVETINNLIFQNSYVICAGKDMNELERVKNCEPSTRSPVKCIMKNKDGTIEDYIIKREVFLYDEDKDMEQNYITYIGNYMTQIKGKVGRNSHCICGSGKKYKNCCMKKYESAKDLLFSYEHRGAVDYMLPGAEVAEKPIEEFIGKADDLSNHQDRDLLKQIQKLQKDKILNTDIV